MTTGTGYRQAKLADAWDAIVIGSGIGGLTAAVLMAVHGGKRVLVLERHDEAGGFTHTFHRAGFQWDVGLHYIGQMEEGSAVRRSFDHVTAGQVEWQRMPEVYDRVIVGDLRFDFAAGVERFREGLKRVFPAEGRAIDRYITAVMACNRASGLYYAEKAIPGAIASLVGGLMRIPYMRWARQTTAEVLGRMTTNPELIGVLTAQWGDYGLPPGRSSFAVHATIAEHYFGGAWYPVGGAGTIARSIVGQLERRGGALATSAEVAEILVDGEKAAGVRMSDGREFRASLVVSDAGASNTLERLLPAELTAMDSLRRELRGIESSTAHLSLYVGLSKSDSELGLKGTNLWVYPSLDHDGNVRRFARDVDSPFPVVYLSFPSAKDPTFQHRYPGKSTVEAITMAPYEAFANWAEAKWKRRGEDYEALKRRLADRLLEELERQAPAVKGNVEHMELSTPVTTRHFMNYERGEIYGIASTPERFKMRALGARTPIQGLLLTGQDVASLGVIGALFGGVICASVALGRNLLSVVKRQRLESGE